MNDIMIQVEKLAKQYRLGNVSTGTIAHDLNRWWHSIRGKENPYLKIGEVNDRTQKGESEYVWALRDIDLDVRQGDVVGIIGRNGAGKSTLLKILSKVTQPSLGQVKLKGRVASLLEVGTGFHPELSGRENIFLNGAILGMQKKEIRQKFDNIVDFSGIDRYIDTPVKRYSSGMYVRLAFAVAAHLESEILIVDEVLAVGDVEFQKKCMGKMNEVSKGQGRTVLFVSHNLSSIQSLCNKSIYLKNGLVGEPLNETSKVIDKYLKDLNTVILSVPLHQRTDREGEGEITIFNMNVKNEKDEEITNLISGQKAIFCVSFCNTREIYDSAPVEVALSISRQGGQLIGVLSNKYLNASIKDSRHLQTVYFILEKLPLMSGTYIINIMLKKGGVIQDWLKEAKTFEVENGDYYKTGLNVPESHNSVYIDYTVSINENN